MYNSVELLSPRGFIFIRCPNAGTEALAGVCDVVDDQNAIVGDVDAQFLREQVRPGSRSLPNVRSSPRTASSL